MQLIPSALVTEPIHLVRKMILFIFFINAYY